MSKQTRSQRLGVIANLLRTHEVIDQAILLELLRDRNTSITQEIFSTYLAELGATKGMRPGSFRSYYQLPLAPQAGAITTQPTGLIPPTVGFRPYALSEQVLIIRMEPGFAQLIATALDSSLSSLSLGSMAGYDTVIAALTEEATDAEAIDWLRRIILKFTLTIGEKRRS